MADSLGDLVVTITGDYGPLSVTLNIVENLASSSGGAITSSFDSAAGSTGKLDTAMEALEAQISATGGELQTYVGTLTSVFTSTGSISGQINQMISAAQTAAPVVQNLDQALAGFAQSAGDKGK